MNDSMNDHIKDLIGKDRIRQIEAKALNKLRQPGRSKSLRVFLEGASREWL